MNGATITLSDGRKMPQIGYGLGGVSADVATGLVTAAIDAGYRLIDTATIYGNEAEVGAALAQTPVPRADLFITTKCWPDRFGYDQVRASFDDSMNRLGLENLDLYLLHWPAPALDLYVESWRALIELRNEGRVNSIGVSNFSPGQLQRIADETGVMPVINQIELHPYFQRHTERAFHLDNAISTECWSPLGRSRCFDDPIISAIAKKHGKSPAQIILGFLMEQNLIVIPRSRNAGRIKSNLDLGGFTLDTSDCEQMRSLDRGADGKLEADPEIAK